MTFGKSLRETENARGLQGAHAKVVPVPNRYRTAIPNTDGAGPHLISLLPP